MQIPVKNDDPLDHYFELQMKQVQDSYQEQVDSLGSGGTVKTCESLKLVPQGV